MPGTIEEHSDDEDYAGCDAEHCLFDNLRVHRSAFQGLDHHAMDEISRALGSRKARLCSDVLLNIEEG